MSDIMVLFFFNHNNKINSLCFMCLILREMEENTVSVF